MFNTQSREHVITNEKRDLKKLSILMRRAVGHNTIPEFANKCGIPNSAKRIADIIHEKTPVYTELGFLKRIALGSDFRISFDELKIVCGYNLNDDEIDLRTVEVHRGYIYLCDYGNVIDSEMGGIRPSLVMQNPRGNTHSSTTLVIPISSKIGKNKMPTHVRIGQESGLRYESEILVEQARTVSKRRLMTDDFPQIICECPQNILRLVEIAMMKQTGIASLNLNDSVVDRFLNSLDDYTQKLENNYKNNYVNNDNSNCNNANLQVAFG